MKIGLIDYIRNVFTLPRPATQSNAKVSDWDELYSTYKDTHLRQAALDTVVGKIAASSFLISFSSKDETLNYRMNYKANDNLNAVDFREQVIKKLILEGECLVIPIGSKLYIADSFSVERLKEMEGYFYKDITVGDFAMQKTYQAKEVFHFKYFNPELKKFIRNLDDEYAKLFKRMIGVHMREQQIRLYSQFKFLKGSDKSQEEQLKDFKKYLNGFRNEIENEQVAILPRQLDYDIEEKSQSFLGRSVTEIGDLENMYIKQVANILQVPPLLFSGDLADISQHREAFVAFCIKPLMEIIVTEINAKYFSQKEIKEAKQLHYNTIQLQYNSELDMAKNVRTMMESAVWTIDMINEILGKPKEDTPITNKRFITRNMAPLSDDGEMQL
ncbi:phage portal protein [Facklamia hominis]|uniref:phage portal protein n=1 Tax=Facklamia hominis TaxID=178214 RepID=UPI0038FD376E